MTWHSSILTKLYALKARTRKNYQTPIWRSRYIQFTKQTFFFKHKTGNLKEKILSESSRPKLKRFTLKSMFLPPDKTWFITMSPQMNYPHFGFTSVQSLGRVWLLATTCTVARQASMPISNSRSPPKPMSIESVMPSNHLILCRPLLLPPSIFPRIRVFSNESALRIRWPKIGVSASTSVLPMNTQDSSPIGWTGWISLQSKGLSRVFSNTTVQKHQFFYVQLSL